MLWTMLILYWPILCPLVRIIFMSIPDSNKIASEEASKLNQLQILISDTNLNNYKGDPYYEKESFLRRWLQARNWVVSEAYKMLQEAYQWRNENGIDSILNETILHFPRSPYTFDGFDNDGRPVVFITPTSTDLRKLILQGKRKQVIRAFDQMLERGFYKLKKIETLMSDGEEITQFVAIIDNSGFNVRQHLCVPCSEVYIEWIRHYENYYPDALKYLVMINMHETARTGGEFSKPFGSPATRKAMKMFGIYQPVWSEFLLSIIAADQLPVRYGGTKSNN